MAKIYIVFTGDYEDHAINFITYDKQEAIHYVRKHYKDDRWSNGMSVYEAEVDKPMSDVYNRILWKSFKTGDEIYDTDMSY